MGWVRVTIILNDPEEAHFSALGDNKGDNTCGVLEIGVVDGICPLRTQ